LNPRKPTGRKPVGDEELDSAAQTTEEEEVKVEPQEGSKETTRTRGGRRS